MTTIDTTTTERATQAPAATAEFLVDAYEFSRALITLKPAIANRGGALPVLSGVMIVVDDNGVRMTGTDLDLTISVPLLSATAVGHGRLVVPLSTLTDFVKGVTKTSGVTLRVAETDTDAELTLDDLTMKARVLPNDEFPRRALEQADPKVTVTVDTTVFADVLSAASGDDARPILTGVLVSGTEVVATDSYRLHIVSNGLDIGDGNSALIPSRSLTQVVRLGPVADMAIAEREVRFTYPSGVEVTSRLIEGEFPNYKGLLPTDPPNSFRFTDPTDLLAGLRKIAPFCKEATPVRFVADSSSVTLQSIVQDSHSIDRVIPSGRLVFGAHDGAHTYEQTVAFNPGYLIDMLTGMVEHVDEIDLGFSDHQKPMYVEVPRMVPDGEPTGKGKAKVQAYRQAGTLRRLIMPVRV